jgi:anti-sigma B factor antagonist
LESRCTVNVSGRDGVTHVSIAGEIDLTSASMIREAVNAELSSAETTGVVIDLSEVTFLDSSGIGLLLTCQRLAEAAGRAFSAAGARGLPAQILDMTGVTGYLAGTETD